MRRRILGGIGTGAAALLLTACPGERDPGAAAPQRGGTVIVVEGADMDKPMPLLYESALDVQLSDLLFRPLLQSSWEDGELRYLTHDEAPTALARSYEFFGPDSASLRYRMVTDAVWSDGTPITAHDVVWTLEARGDPRVASPRQDFNRQIREIVAEDDSTVVVHFHRRYPDMFFHSANDVAPRHVYADHDPALLRTHPTVTDPAGGRMVVSGPFMIGEWVRGQRVTLVPNPRGNPQPNLDRIVLRVVPEPTTRLIELQTGTTDMMSPVPYDQLPAVRGQNHLRIEPREKRHFDFIGYNPRAHDFFADPDVRRALGLAIDKEGIIRALQMDEFAIPAGGPYAPIFRRLYDPEEQAPLPYDPEQARTILAEKGWTAGPDGILRKDGRPFRFSLATNAGNQRRADVAQIVQQQWRRIGVDARIQIIEFNTFIERMVGRNYEAVVAGWSIALSPDLQQLWAEPDLPFNIVMYDNPQVRQLIQQALAQPTEEAAAPVWREVAARIVADQPYTWLYYFDELVGVNHRVQGTVINTLGTYQRMWEWWVRDGAEAALTP